MWVITGAQAGGYLTCHAFAISASLGLLIQPSAFQGYTQLVRDRLHQVDFFFGPFTRIIWLAQSNCTGYLIANADWYGNGFWIDVHNPVTAARHQHFLGPVALYLVDCILHGAQETEFWAGTQQGTPGVSAQISISALAGFQGSLVFSK